VLTQMRYAEELVDTDAYTFPAAKDIRKPELQMAKTLVENLHDTWDPSQFTDEYRQNLMKIVKARMKGKEPKLEAVEEPEQAEVVDLMERLRASLQNAGGASKRKAARPKKASPRAKRKRAA
jgi:DNA end-binding protein Ku